MRRRLSGFVNAIAPAPSGRSAATLVEVLMSLLIFGVGIVSVFALFPLSILSSVRATQLTHGRIAKDNAQELVYTIPDLVRPPFGYPWNDTDFPWRGQWEPLRNYAVDDIIIPTILPGKVFPMPYFALRCTAGGQSDAVEPVWNASQYQYVDGDARWVTVRVPNFVVDPIGYYRAFERNDRIVFGNNQVDASLRSFLSLRSPGPVRDVTSDGVIADVDVSRLEPLFTRVFTSPDSWSVQLQQTPISVSTGSTSATVVFPPDVDASGFIVMDPNFPHTRVVLTSLDGSRSVVRYPTGVASGAGGTELTLDQPIGRPEELLGTARVETYTSRYTYFLTVSNYTTVAPTSGSAAVNELVEAKESLIPPKVSIAIVFNRRSSPDSEYAYRANFGNPGFSADVTVADTGLAADEVKIYWSTADDEPPPFLKVGSYVLDARKLVFYRITAIRDETGSSAILTVDHPIDRGAQTRNDMGVGLAILMPGIVHVFNLDGVQ